ncbi:hypothetical protein G6011_08273 [Alternaria panax]|uniref:Uncharacterized protein n=1 Tax=Alternaria panax TaxID=48097 RepID=A0AAD4I5Z1_9PLEO|nr:hypothetical protein G6011_08273 [Alternaria panax]
MPFVFQVANLAVRLPKVGENGYQGFNPRKDTLSKGHQSRDGACELYEDMIAEHDVTVKVRDGCTLYCHIYRPVGSDKSDAKVPTIVSWSLFGKKDTGIDMMSKVRATARSDWLATHISATFNGSSWRHNLHFSKPSHPRKLAVISTESTSYEEERRITGFFDFITERVIRGKNDLEDFKEMYRQSSTMNPCWTDKRADIASIKIPTYIVASPSSFVHTMGSIRG